MLPSSTSVSLAIATLATGVARFASPIVDANVGSRVGSMMRGAGGIGTSACRRGVVRGAAPVRARRRKPMTAATAATVASASSTSRGVRERPRDLRLVDGAMVVTPLVGASVDDRSAMLVAALATTRRAPGSSSNAKRVMDEPAAAASLASVAKQSTIANATDAVARMTAPADFERRASGERCPRLRAAGRRTVGVAVLNTTVVYQQCSHLLSASR